MVLPQRVTIESEFSVVPREVAGAASRYQRMSEIEKGHLAAMARHNLLDEWSGEVRAVVLEARRGVQEARAARDSFRAHVRDFVVALRGSGEPMSAVLRHVRTMMQL